MKNRIIITLFAAGLFVACSENKEEVSKVNSEDVHSTDSGKDTSYVQYIAKNKITEIIATGYAYKFGEPTEGSKLYKVSYNKDGYLLDSLIYHQNGVLGSLKNTYDDNNKLLKSAILDSVGNVQQLVERTYDKNGNVLTFQLTQGNIVLYSQKMLYDNADKMTKITEFDGEGQPQIITNYSYNEKGKLIENEEIRSTGEVIEKTVFVYDEKGRNTVQTIYGSDGQVIEKNFLKEYDKNDNAQLIEKYDRNDSLIVTYSYTYNNVGNETKSIIYNGIGQIIRQSMASFDGNGDQVGYEVYEGGKGLVGKDERKYNSDHQEIELIVYDNKENQVKRKISNYNDKGLLSEVINYDKIDEPLFRITLEYKYQKN